jgi:hypothetical protein
MSSLPTQEPDRLDSRRIAMITALTLLGVVIAVGLSTFPLRHLAIGSDHTATSKRPATIGIVEQSAIDDAHRARDLRDAQRGRLTQYRWLDDRHDLAEIPIDRAMSIVAEKKR